MAPKGRNTGVNCMTTVKVMIVKTKGVVEEREQWDLSLSLCQTPERECEIARWY